GRRTNRRVGSVCILLDAASTKFDTASTELDSATREFDSAAVVVNSSAGKFDASPGKLDASAGESERIPSGTRLLQVKRLPVIEPGERRVPSHAAVVKIFSRRDDCIRRDEVIIPIKRPGVSTAWHERAINADARHIVRPEWCAITVRGRVASARGVLQLGIESVWCRIPSREMHRRLPGKEIQTQS